MLNPIETRVLGALLEKELTTPDYYPLSLNALVAACNQKSNREPVMTLDEGAVKLAVRALDAQDLAGAANTNDSRVTKYEHRLGEAFNFGRAEAAILCELLLRGPQTPGELRSRAARMHPPSGTNRALFEDIDGAQSTLQRLMKREPPLVRILPRQSGTKEARYAQILSGDVQEAAPDTAQDTAPERAQVTEPDKAHDAVTVSRGAAATKAAQNVHAGGPLSTGNAAHRDETRGDSGGEGGRIARLEREVATLRAEIAALSQKFADFRKQFE